MPNINVCDIGLTLNYCVLGQLETVETENGNGKLKLKTEN